MTAVIELRGVDVVRRGRKLLDDIRLDFRSGKVTGIIGPNGAGKSTLLRVMAGEIRPEGGTVELDGQDLQSHRAGRLAARRAVVPQATALAFPFTAIEVVELGGTVPGFGITDQRVQIIAMAALDVVGMRPLAGRFFTELSGGERQRVQFARALCQLDCASWARGKEHAPVLLLDEPTASLDLAHQLAVLDEAQRRARAGAVVVTVLHDLNLAARYADEVILLSRGKVASRGAPADTFDDAVLAEAFDVQTRVNMAPVDGTPFLLPQTLSLRDHRSSHDD
ncbi:MAG: heme ABC transporter ATP-binding protein [Hyphomicrobiaceae bacterium]